MLKKPSRRVAYAAKDQRSDSFSGGSNFVVSGSRQPLADALPYAFSNVDEFVAGTVKATSASTIEDFADPALSGERERSVGC